MSSDLLDAGAVDLSRACRIDSACDRFETAWKTGNQPRIEDHLGEIAGPDRLVLARELILLDIHYRRLAGQTCLVDEYDTRFPGLDPTWLATVILGRPSSASTPTESHPPDEASHALTTTNNGEPASPLSAGLLQSFGDYEIRGVIGESGMGVVYKVWQRSLNRFVALKTIKHSQFLSRSSVQRFRAEAEMAAHLDHPNIVPIYEVNEHEGQPYFTMKLIEGGSLAQPAIVLQGPGTDKETQRNIAALMAKVARAVHHAHQRGILHRDLKPANILLEWPAGADGQPVPQVADFGLAKRLGGDTRATVEGTFLGTPVYTAPEQALGIPDLTTAVDVHGLGAVLYYLLTGEPPFKAETISETLHQVIECEPARPRSLKPGVDRDLEIICLRCLEKRPQDRIRSAEALAEELDLWLAGKPIQSRSASTPEKILKWVRRRPAVAALLAVSTIAMLALVAFGVGLSYSAQLQAANADLNEARGNLESVNGALETAIGEKDTANGQLGNALKDVRQEKIEVEKQRQLARRFLYVSQINLAERARSEGKPGLALQLLESVAPKEAETEDLRGPEWYHLWNTCNGYAYSLSGHTAPITAMEFSPDGKWLAAGAVDGRVIIWDTSAGKIRQSFPGSGNGVSAIQFTEDSRILAAVGEREPLGAWEVLSGRELATSSIAHTGEHDQAASNVLDRLTCLQQERQQFVSSFSLAAYYSNTWSTWATRLVGGGSGALPTMEILATTLNFPMDWYPDPQRSNVDRMAFMPDNRLAAVSLAAYGTSSENKQMLVIDTASDRKKPGAIIKFDASRGNKAGVMVVDSRRGRILEYISHSESPRCTAALSVCGRQLAWKGEDRIIHVRDLERRQDLRSFAFNSSPGLLAFSHDNKYLASADADQRIRVWDLKHEQADSIFKTGEEVNNVVFSPIGSQVAAQGGSGTTSIWEVPSGKAIYRSPRDSNGKRLAYSEDGRWISDGTKITEVATGNEVSRLNKRDAGAFGTAFSPDNNLVASAWRDGVDVWERATGTVLYTLKAPPARPVCVAFSPDGKLLAAGSSASTGLPGGVRVWDVTTRLEVFTYLPSQFSTYCLAFSPDGKQLALGTGSASAERDPGSITVLDTQTWREVFSLYGHTNSIWWVAFSPDGKRLASASGRHNSNPRSSPGEIKIWDLTVGQELLTLRGHTGCIRGVSFSPNGKVLVSGSADGTIRLWGDLDGRVP
jgi:WD40 repeat protein/serine/threonine protein kinase